MEITVSDLFKSKEANILPCVMLKENCKFDLSKTVHEEFLDLVLYYKLYLNHTGSKDFDKSMLISNLFLGEILGITEFAFKNMVNIFVKNQYEVRPLHHVLKEIAEKLPQDDSSRIKEMLDTSNDSPFFIVSNSFRFQGASVLYYPFVFSDLAAKFMDDLFIIPSSIHEIITVPYKLGKCFELFDMVKEVNESVVEEDEFLKTGIYRYNRKSNEIVIVENL